MLGPWVPAKSYGNVDLQGISARKRLLIPFPLTLVLHLTERSKNFMEETRNTISSIHFEFRNSIPYPSSPR